MSSKADEDSKQGSASKIKHKPQKENRKIWQGQKRHLFFFASECEKKKDTRFLFK